jgi:sugar lactone lactonase YvrE
MMRRSTAVLGFSLVAFLAASSGLRVTGVQQEPVITTIAGGNVGDGRKASEALLNQPEDVVVDPQGNIYFVEKFYERVRRIDAVTKVITTVAGNGVTGFSGDGGLAINASFNRPEGLALDANGNIYIADFNNNRVRKVDVRTGIITTFAGNGTPPRRATDPAGDGGPAIEANLSHPVGLAFDAGGNLYIGDLENNRVRKVDTRGTITTFAGNGRTNWNQDYVGPATGTALKPAGLAFDAMGNLYIADYDNHLIRKVDKNGMISTVAGDFYKVPRSPQDMCLSFKRPGEGRYQNGVDDLADRPARLISLNFPQDVAVDAQGNVYIADSFNHRIRKLTPEGQLCTIAGTGEWKEIGGAEGGFEGEGTPAKNARLNLPAGVAVDQSGNILIADSGNDRIRKIDASGIITTVAGGPNSFGDEGLATQAGVYVPLGVAVDANGNIFIAEPATFRVRRVDAQTRIITTVAGNGLPFNRDNPGDIGDGGPATRAYLFGPTGLAVDSKGNLFISEILANRVRKVDAMTGMITTYAGGGNPPDTSIGDNGPAIQARLKSPRGLAVDASDNLYIADSCHHRIRRVDVRTEIITTVAGNGFLFRHECLPDEMCIGVFAGDNQKATDASLSTPFDVAVDRDGNILIADTGNRRVRMVDTTGKMAAFAGTDPPLGLFNPDNIGDNGPARNAKFGRLISVAVDPMGNVFVGDAHPQVHRVRRIDRASLRIMTVTGTGAEAFTGDGGPATSAANRGPGDIAVLPGGGFVFTDVLNHRLRLVR